MLNCWWMICDLAIFLFCYFSKIFHLVLMSADIALHILNLLADVSMKMESHNERKLPVLETATALATSFVICKASTHLTRLCGIQGGSLPVITALVVVLATLLPTHFAYLAPFGDTIAVILMQVAANFCQNSTFA